MKILRKCNILIILLFFFPFPSSNFSQVTLSEIMFNPVQNDQYYEFIEIYNFRSDSAIDLTGWQISDGAGSDELREINQGMILGPKQFAVIFDMNYFEHAQIYQEQIPPEALILTINGSTFGSGGLSNSTSEIIFLINSSGDTVSEYQYSLDNSEGYSDEKIELNGLNVPDNWGNSEIINGSPGRINTVSPKKYDVSLKIYIEPEQPEINCSVNIYGIVKNVGTESLSDIEVQFFHDVNNDSVAENSEQIQSTVISRLLLPNDSTEVMIRWEKLSAGIYTIIGSVQHSLDQNELNDIIYKQLAVGYHKNSLIINEIMFQPFSDAAEWIEIYNPNPYEMDLSNWKISDSHLNNKNIISANIRIAPFGYVLISENEDINGLNPELSIPVIILPNWSVLNNSNDMVILYDYTDSVIDSVYYSGKWSSKTGISLERRDHDLSSCDSVTWAPSIDISGATPGFENSVIIPEYDVASQQIVFSDSFPQPFEIIDIIVTITNTGKNKTADFEVCIFNDRNKDTQLDIEELVTDCMIVPDSLNRDSSIELTMSLQNLVSGVHDMYAVIKHPLDLISENDTSYAKLSVSYESQTLIINEIMYSPFNNEPEWIELYNPTSDRVNCQNWSLSDKDTSSRTIFIEEPLYLPAGSFLVISKDSLRDDLYGNKGLNCLIIPQFPNLNNDADNIVIYDNNKNIIDLVPYKKTWGGGTGISLERINPALSSIDSSNWNSCAYAQGGTAGCENSIFIATVPASAAIEISPDPFSPDGDGIDDVAIINYKVPLSISSIHIKIYDMRGRLVRFLHNNKITGAIGAIIWDGRNDDGNLCRIGIYIVYLQALNAARGVVVSHKQTLVLAAKL